MPKSQGLPSKKLKNIFQAYPQIKLVYFFGSKANDTDGPLSDYDFAFYLDEKNKKKIFDTKIDLINDLTDLFKTDDVDVVILNTAEGPELKYHIIKDGKLIYEKQPFKIIVEPQILNEYFDFNALLLRHGLTKAHEQS